MPPTCGQFFLTWNDGQNIKHVDIISHFEHYSNVMVDYLTNIVDTSPAVASN
jgi:hypothetical protein